MRLLPSASLIHPVFEGLRVDKEVNKTDIRFSQLQERVVLQDPDQKVESIEFPSSNIVRREVWSKLTKGEKGVQKLIVLKTNKEKKEKSFPAFAVHWTDYSLSRKDPRSLLLLLCIAPGCHRIPEQKIIALGP